jgi:hypothetical protein
MRYVSFWNLFPLNSVITSKKFDPQDAFANIFGEHRRPKAPRLADQVPASAGGLNKTSKLLTGLLGNRTN